MKEAGVIDELQVESWSMLLDQRALEEKCLLVRLDQRGMNRGGGLDQEGHHRSVIGATDIGSSPSPEALGLSDIDGSPTRIQKLVDARSLGQCLDLGLQGLSRLAHYEALLRRGVNLEDVL